MARSAPSFSLVRHFCDLSWSERVERLGGTGQLLSVFAPCTRCELLSAIIEQLDTGAAERRAMGEVDAARRGSAPSLDRWGRDTEPAAEPKSPEAAPWNADYDKIPARIRQYDQALFTNPALVAHWPGARPSTAPSPIIRPGGEQPVRTEAMTTCTNVIPPPPPPLGPGLPPSAANAYRGIQLHCLAENLPDVSRSAPDKVIKSGHYKLHPMLARQADGSEAAVYWTAYNTDTKRTEFVVGPGDLAIFTSAPDRFEVAAANAYMHGEPNKWTLESMKVVDAAMRRGTTESFTHLGRAWVEAVKDPDWWMQNAAAAGVFAEGPALAGEATTGSRRLPGRVSTELPEARHLGVTGLAEPRRLPLGAAPEAAPSTPPAAVADRVSVAATEPAPTSIAAPSDPRPSQMGKASPVVQDGGLKAHEGGAARGHLIREHLDKTEADLMNRVAASASSKRPIQHASAFHDRATAELAASRTLAANETKVNEWLANGAKRKLVITESNPGGPPVGLRFTRGEARAVPVTGTRLVLVGDASKPCGFRILTGFPVP